MAFAANLSVVTYTFNDAPLARGLLESLSRQNVAPREIVVVDDGSAEPFSPPATNPETRLIRLEPNQGATRAKQAGLDAAASKFILSIDADVRLCPGWIAAVLALAARPGVGLVSSEVAYDSGTDLASRYLALVHGFHPAPGETGYIPGPVWMIRGELWREIGGFAGHRERIGEDSYLCARLRQAGYALVIAEGVSARQVRRLSRAALVKRGFAWQGSHLREELAKGAQLTEAMNVLVYSASKRLPELIRIDPALAYFELLYLAHGLLELAGRGGPDLVRDLRAALDGLVRGYPGLSGLLAADLHRLGHAPAAPGADPAAGAGVSAALANLFDPSLLRRLEDDGLTELAAEGETDFSFYAK
jgi:hypothetical protein